jgi:hypothetical protein
MRTLFGIYRNVIISHSLHPLLPLPPSHVPRPWPWRCACAVIWDISGEDETHNS